MRETINVIIKQNAAKKYKAGYPLIHKEDMQNKDELKEEGSFIRVIDEKQNFVGLGFYGKQNKGYGWILTNRENERIDSHFFKNRIQAAINQRESFFSDTETTAFRVFNGEGDGVGGLTIDYYNGFYVISWYSEGIYTFREDIIQALREVVNYKGIYQKKRFSTDGAYIEEDDFVTGERGEFPIIVKENGVNFAVYLNEGAMVGVFLDQREVRKKIRDKYAEGKNVLNTFSYTGAFSVFAALGGAVKTTSVDLANRSLPKTIEQFSVNGIDYEAQDIKVMDVFDYFKYAVRKKLTFDMVILDPPSFARSKKVTFSVGKDYKNLLKEAIQMTEKNGVIVASTNFSGLSRKKFKGFVDAAFKESGGKYEIVEEFSLPEDFKTVSTYKEGDYLKVVFIRKK